MTKKLHIGFCDPGLIRQIDQFLASSGMGFNPYLERRARLHDAAALSAQSDAELRAMGLSGEDNPS
jgi:hypothetical protein